MLTLLLALLIGVIVTLILPIVSLVQSSALRRRMSAIEARLRELERLPPIKDVPVTPPAAAPTTSTPAEPSARPAESLETAIGSRWMLYAGVTVLLLGMSFFLKLAIDNEWINETTRILLGCAAGLALIAGGMTFVKRGYSAYGQILAGGGVAVLYFSVYAAFAYYRLISQGPAFALLVLVTLAAATLADRQASQGLALVAVVGGFATPFLVGREGGSHMVLFTYDAILVGGTMALARRRAWPLLNLASFALTLFTVASWYVRSYQPPLYLSFEIFLTLFCAMFVWVRYEGRHSTDPLGTGVRASLLLAPVFYHAASLSILDQHATAYLIYLTTFTAAGVAAGVQRQSAWLRLIVWLAVWLPALGWIDGHANLEWLSRIIATIGALYAMHLLAQLKKIGDREALADPDIALLHLNGLGLLAGLYLTLENVRVSSIGPIAFALAAWNGLLAIGIRPRDLPASLHWTAVAGALAATALALEFDGTWVTVGWAAEGAGLVWLGLSVSRGWLRWGGGLLLTLAALRVIGPDYEAIRSGFTPIINARFAAGALIVALLYWLARLHSGTRGSGLGARDTSPAAPGFSRTEAAARSIAIALLGANALTLVLLTQEITAYWPRNESVAASLMRESLISITWAVYAAGLVAAGIRNAYPPIRYLAIGVFGLTIVKVFTVDLANLGGIYRVLGFIVVGAVLLGASFLYQRQLKVERE